MSFAFALAFVATALGAPACSSPSGNGTVNAATNGSWGLGATAAAGPIESGRHFPWELLLPDGECPDPDAEMVCSDGAGCCPTNGVCCSDGSCAADANLCTIAVIATGCPASAPVSCGAVCCGSTCCPDGTCDDCSTGNSTDDTPNPYATATGDDTSGGGTTNDPGTTDPPDPEPSTPDCGDGQYVCGDDCCDSKAPGAPVHTRKHK